MNESITIIIPTRNRSAVLQLCLNALPAGSRGFPPPEVIVVDDCSTDATPQVVEHFARETGWPVRCVRQKRPMGANVARNTAVKIAGGTTIVLIDDDVIVTDGWLAKLIGGLSSQRPVVSGSVQLTLDGPILGKHREEVSGYLCEVLSEPYSAPGEIVPLAGNMAAFRWVFDRALFDDNVRPPLEEQDWLRRAGVHAGFVPEALVWHHKTTEDVCLPRILRMAWFRGSEGGWWTRERLKVSLLHRLPMAARSFQTACRAFGHAIWQRCWGGVVVGLGELSRALALAGLINRGTRVPGSWR